MLFLLDTNWKYLETLHVCVVINTNQFAKLNPRGDYIFNFDLHLATHRTRNNDKWKKRNLG